MVGSLALNGIKGLVTYTVVSALNIDNIDVVLSLECQPGDILEYQAEKTGS